MANKVWNTSEVLKSADLNANFANTVTNSLTVAGGGSIGGVLTVPTAAAGTATAQIATTAFVTLAIGRFPALGTTATVTALAGTPLVLTAGTNIVTTCPAGGGVQLPSLSRVIIINRSANNVIVSPPTGGSIEGQATQFILPGYSATFISADSTAYYAV